MNAEDYFMPHATLLECQRQTPFIPHSLLFSWTAIQGRSVLPIR
jgi:hypothetical protein